mmetsp:Transcript_28409/g.54142  ORF Transcript_28409/g.54142 Transcript_28409/m.54142 type:complete len:200 (+) Transcript_28409:1018-1617(+)
MACLQQPSHAARQLVHCRLLVAISVSDHLSLFGELGGAIHTSGREGHDGLVGGPSPAAERAAAAVEHAELDPSLLAHVKNYLLGLVKPEGGGEHAAVLARVAVAQHHLLGVVVARHQLAVRLVGHEVLQGFRHSREIGDGLKERGHVHVAHPLAVLLLPDEVLVHEPAEEQHLQHIVCRLSHGDAVRPNRFVGDHRLNV